MTRDCILHPVFEDNYTYKLIENFADNGFAAVKINTKWGFINETGRLIINPQFEKAKIIDNILFVKWENKWGIIDNQGNWIVNPQFDDIK